MKIECAITVLALLAMFGSGNVFSQPAAAGNNKPGKSAHQTIALWPNGAPGEKGNAAPETNTTKPTDAKPGNKALIRLANVSTPTLTVYRANDKQDAHMAMVVCPGGGYNILAMDLEGTEVCEWLNSLGITALLLKYRVPRREGIPMYQAPLQDAQRALGLVRLNAAKWGINPQAIGIMGFSAGGHLSAALSNNFTERTYPPVDDADRVSCRPDFTMLVYPAYLTIKEKQDSLAPELQVSKNTPPTLLIQTGDDPVRVESSLFYYLALKRAGVPAEMHLYPTGGHGYGLRIKEGNISTWPNRATEWLKTVGRP